MKKNFFWWLFRRGRARLLRSLLSSTIKILEQMTQTAIDLSKIIKAHIDRTLRDAVRENLIAARPDYPLSFADIAKQYPSVTKSMLHQWSAKGLLKTARRGKQCFIKRADFESFLLEKQKPVKADTSTGNSK
jgi:hypothetical protein